MESEKGKLITLLNYLIEHNTEHSKELTELAEKSKAVANNAALNKIRKASRIMMESTEYLKQALAEVSKD
jgi:hypothetical protein